MSKTEELTIKFEVVDRFEVEVEEKWGWWGIGFENRTAEGGHFYEPYEGKPTLEVRHSCGLGIHRLLKEGDKWLLERLEIVH